MTDDPPNPESWFAILAGAYGHHRANGAGMIGKVRGFILATMEGGRWP